MDSNMKMLTKIILICSINILILVITNVANCQHSNTIDSLKLLVISQSDDSNKVISTMQLVNELCEIDPATALHYCRQAYDLSQKINYTKGKISVLYDQSYIYKTMGNLDSAIVCINEYISIGNLFEDSLMMARGYQQLGNLIRRKGETINARKLYSQSLNLYRHLDDTSGMICAYNALGITYKYTSDFDSAALYYFKTLELCELINYEWGIGPTLLNLGKVYIELKDFENARKYTEQSIVYSSKLNVIRNVALAYTNLGIIAISENKNSEALKHYYKALDYNKQIENEIGINNLFINIGNVYKSEQKYEKALEHYKKAIDAFSIIGYKTGLVSALMSSADVYTSLGQYKKAFQLLDSCLLITFDTGEKHKRIDVYESIYRACLQAENFRRAFEYLEKFHELKDSIYNIEKEQIITELLLKYEKEKDQALILMLENENLAKDLSLRKRTNQRNIYLFSGLGIVAIILFLLIYFRLKARKDGIISAQRILQLEEEKKLLAARSIVEGQEEERKRIAKDLHDGLGVILSTVKMHLSIIKDKSVENKPMIEKASKLLEQATGDVRRISHNMMPGLLTKLGLFEATEDLFDRINETEEIKANLWIDGEQTRFPENIEIMLYRIIQELVNNTIKHAEATILSLNIEVQSGLLKIDYSDNGKGFNVDEKLDSKTMGLSSMQSRVNFLNGKVDIESEKGKGSSYTIFIPV